MPAIRAGEYIIMLGYGIAVIAVLGAAVYGLFFHRALRRRRVQARPMPAQWQQWLRDDMALYRRLPDPERERLHHTLMLLLDEVAFYGCAGLAVTEAMKVLIAAHGALLVNGLSMDYYRDLRSILVYPGAYRAAVRSRDGAITVQTEQDRLGESWQSGRVILSWDSFAREAADPESVSNVALHEFAHQLDQLDGAADGAPPLASGETARHWQQVFTDAWERLRHNPAHDHNIIDPYGATNPAEFFAVVTETFFLQPHPLCTQEPALYNCLSRFYRLSPIAWAGATRT